MTAPTQAQPVGEWEKSEYGSYPVLKWSETYKAKIGEKLYATPQPVAAPEWVSK